VGPGEAHRRDDVVRAGRGDDAGRPYGDGDVPGRDEGVVPLVAGLQHRALGTGAQCGEGGPSRAAALDEQVVQ
jgi:hypothetical protein